MQAGVGKLSEARDLVNHLQTDAGEQEKLLELKQHEAKSALEKITETIKSAGVKRNEMQTLRSTIAEENVLLLERYITVTSFVIIGFQANFNVSFIKTKATIWCFILND